MPEYFEKLFLVAIGSLLTWFGGILSDARRERTRKKEKLEAAYSEWLARYVSLLRRLRATAQAARSEPKSLEVYKSRIEGWEALRSDLYQLALCLNTALILERKKEPREALEVLTNTMELLTSQVDTLLSHQRRHLEFRSLIEELPAADDQIEPLMSGELQAGSEEGDIQGDESTHRQLDELKTQAVKHLATCGDELSMNAASVLSHLDRLESGFSLLRTFVTGFHRR